MREGLMTAELQLLSPLLAVAFTALLVMVVSWFTDDRDARVPGGIAVAGLAVAGVLGMRLWRALGPGDALPAFSRPAPALGEGARVALLRFDALGVYALLALILVAVVVSLSAIGYLQRNDLFRSEFYFVMLVATASMMLLAVSDDLIMIFLAIEAFSIALYVLCALRRSERLSQEAALKYFVLGAFSAGFQLYGVALLYAETGVTALPALAASLTQPTPLAWAGVAMLVVGLAFKVALVPFHQWTPDVYDGAPTIVTAFMAAGTKLAAFVALVRVMWTAFPGLSETLLPLLTVLAVATMVVGNLAALVQGNLKRMLAYSAVAHAGYLLVGVAAGPVEGTPAVLFYLLIYGLTNLGAFAVLMALGPLGEEGRDATRLEDLAGLARRHPWLAALLSLFLLSLTGLPPTAGFLAKWYIFRAAIDAGLLPLAIILVLNSVVSAFYYVRPIAWMTMREAAPDAPAIEVDGPNAVALTLAGAVVALALLVGRPLIEGAQRAAGQDGVATAERGEMAPGVFFTAPQLDKDGR
jgi:NADH-quinone oxidoreductase subunit N